MFERVNKSFFYLALIYLVVVILESISWPLGNIFFFENALFVPAFFFASYVTFKEKTTFLPIYVLLNIVFVCFICIEFISSKSFIYSHFLYLMRWVKYPVVFVLAQYYFRFYNARQVEDFVKTLFLVVVGINIIILTNPFEIGAYLQALHAPKEYFNLSNFHEPGVFRLGGTFTNPNDNAILFSLFFILFAFHSRLKDYYFSALAISMVVFSQSRTALLLCFVIILVSFVYQLFYAKLSKRQWIHTVTVSLVVVVFFAFFNLGYARTLFTGQAFKSESFMSRIEHFKSVFDSSPQNFFFGRGVIDNQVEFFGSYLDSEMAVVFAQFGTIGLVIWLAFVGTLFMISRNRLVENKVYFDAILLFLGVSFTNLSFFNTQLGLLLFAFLGISVARQQKVECNTNKKSTCNPS